LPPVILRDRTESGRILGEDWLYDVRIEHYSQRNQVLYQIATPDPVVFNVGQATFEVLMQLNGVRMPCGVHPKVKPSRSNCT
jgi:hypothetical protein